MVDRFIPGVLDADLMRERAEKRTNKSDWGDPSVHSFLEHAVSSINRDGALNPFGKLAVGKNLQHHLETRLRVLAKLRDEPRNGAEAAGLERPIFVVGLYRSGTTLLHHLLAQLPETRSPAYWELRRPIEQSSSDASRRQRIGSFERTLHRIIAPSFESAHTIDANSPEECLFLFENSCAGTSPFVLSEAHSHAWWLLEQDLRPAYRFYREQLSLLAQDGQRLVLKWPFHLFHLDVLFETFPDATVVICHRDPGVVVPSSCSLARLAKLPMCDHVDLQQLGQFWLQFSSTGMARMTEARTSGRAPHVVDLDYTDLERSPVKTALRIADRVGLEASSNHEEPLREWLSQRKPRRRHRYRASDFGLDGDSIRHQLQPTKRFVTHGASPSRTADGSARDSRRGLA